MQYIAKLLPERIVNTPVKETQSWSYVQMEIVNISYTWTIQNFYHCQHHNRNKFQFKSGIFSTNDESKWYLVVNPSLYKNGINYLSLYLLLISCKNRTVQAKLKLSVNVQGKNYHTQESNCIHAFINYCNRGLNCTFINPGHSSYDNCQHTCDRWGFDTFVSMDSLKVNGSLPETLRIFCEIGLVTDMRNISKQSYAIQLEESGCKLLNNFGLLLENEKFCDVTLTVRGKEFQVHKAILVAQSPVFNVMFENDMKEKKTNQVDIDDMDPEVLKEMLRFIYTGKAPNLEKMADGLLAASDKYQLNTLKVLCQEVLRKSLTIENAAEILILADLHSADQLKAEAINFINTYTDVIDTAGFKSMEKSYLHLIREIYRAIRTNPPTKPVSENK